MPTKYSVSIAHPSFELLKNASRLLHFMAAAFYCTQCSASAGSTRRQQVICYTYIFLRRYINSISSYKCVVPADQSIDFFRTLSGTHIRKPSIISSITCVAGHRLFFSFLPEVAEISIRSDRTKVFRYYSAQFFCTCTKKMAVHQESSGWPQFHQYQNRTR